MLSRENKLMLLFSMVGGALGGAMTMYMLSGTPVIAQESSKSGAQIVSAEEIRLVDKAGKNRAMLAFSSEGEPYLALLDKNEGQRVWLGLSANPGLAIKDNKESKTRVLLTLDDEAGLPSLVLRSRQHQVAIIQPKDQQ